MQSPETSPEAAVAHALAATPHLTVTVVDRDLRYRFANEAALAASGGALDGAVGSYVSDVLPRRVAEPMLVRVKAVLRDGQPSTQTFRSTLPSDPVPGRTWRAHYVPVYDGHGAVDSVVIIGDDVTESEQVRERLESELAATNRINLMLDTQWEMVEQVDAGATMQQVLDTVVHRLERYLELTAYVSVLLYDAEHGILRHGAAPSLPAAYNDAIDGIAVGPKVGSCGTAVHRGEPVIVSNIARDPLWSEFRDLAATHGLAACWSMPVRDAQGDVLGTVAVYHPEPASPTGDDLQLCELFTRTVGTAIERVRLHRTR